MTELKELISKAGVNANNHGWVIVWCTANDIVKDPTLISQSRILQGAILGKQKILTVGDALALLHSEVSEALNAHRNDDQDNFKEECADIAIRLFHMCYDLKIDLNQAIKEKMKINEQRPVNHGRKNY